MARLVRAALVLALCVFVILPSSAREIAGKVVGVVDGDTIDVLVGGSEVVRVRINGIDCPEKGQAFGQAAKRGMSDLVFSKNVVVTTEKTDRYKRLIGKVEIGGKDVGLQLIKDGLAWHFKRYESDQSVFDRQAYAAAEVAARANRLGIWSERSPIAPWDFRKQGRK